MNRNLSAWKWLRGHVQGRAAELRLSLRVTAGALATFVLSEFAQLPLVLWPVLTSIIVMQLSVGKSLKTTLDYFAGTLGGAVYGGIISTLFPPVTEPSAIAVLAGAVAPLAFLAAVNPSFSVAPVTAAIVVLGPLVTHATPVESAFYRLLEVALGGGTGLAVSLMLWPARAHGLALEAAARLLNLIAEGLRELLSSIPEGLDATSLRRIHSGILQPFTRLEAIEGEARREQMARLARDPDLGPLVRTFRRLRHDLIIIGRAAADPLPDAFRNRLAPPLGALAGAAADYMQKCGAALLARDRPPPLGGFEPAIDGFEAEMAALRSQGFTRELPVETVERVFALGFALDQLRHNLNDLGQRVADFAKR